jgi:hypothetical protein
VQIFSGSDAVVSFDLPPGSVMQGELNDTFSGGVYGKPPLSTVTLTLALPPADSVAGVMTKGPSVSLGKLTA